MCLIGCWPVTGTMPPCGRIARRRRIRSTFVSIVRKSVVIAPMPNAPAVPIAATPPHPPASAARPQWPCWAHTTTFRLRPNGPGDSRTSLEIQERHLNSVGIVQGGAIFTLADLAFGMACNSGGKVALAVSTNLSFLKAARSGTLYAEATEVARSRRISTCTVRITDDTGNWSPCFRERRISRMSRFRPRENEGGDQEVRTQPA